MASIITTAVRSLSQLIMAALHSRCGHYIFILWFLLSFFLSCYLFSSPNLSRRRLDVYRTWSWTSTHGGLSANLECRSEMCCTRLIANTGRKKVAKNRHLGTIAQLCRAMSSQPRHISTIGKNLLSSNISSTCPHNMVNFGPLAAEIVSLVWGTPATSTAFASWQRYCTAL